MRALVWFRTDLRTADNPALDAACRQASSGVAAVFLIAKEQWREHGWGPAKTDFVLRNVASLGDTLAALGIPLLVRQAPRFAHAPSVILALAREIGADAVFANEEPEPNERRRDEAARTLLAGAGVRWYGEQDQSILPPAAVRTRDGGFYRVFTPFRAAWLALLERDGAPELARRPAARERLAVEPAGWELLPPETGRGAWPAGEAEGARRLSRFASAGLRAYGSRRDRPAAEGTSRLSPYLAAGVVSARQCLAAAVAAAGPLVDWRSDAGHWVSELVWREFYRHVLAGFPRVGMGRPFLGWTDTIAWREDEGALAAWRDGRTGFPLVDAAMRQLAAEGWVHNRARMVAATFLAKHLLLDWRRGEAVFAERLIDLDLASNNGGWQWCASTGTDAAPYFRIMNPIAQSRRFDPDGSYLKRYLPELRAVAAGEIHEPSATTRRRTGYPAPILDLGEARHRAIAAFAAARGA